MSEQEAILAATSRAVRALGAVPAFDVAVEAVVGPFARVKVGDKAGQLGALYGFAVKKAGVWEVLDLGTDFDDAFYEDHRIPAAIQLLT